MLIKKIEFISDRFLVRQMQESDLDEIVTIENQIATTPWDRQQFLGCTKVYNAIVVCNKNHNSNFQVKDITSSNIVGYGIIAIYNAIEQAQILNIGVKKNYQRSGVGKFLLKYLIDLFLQKTIKDQTINKLKHEYIDLDRSKYQSLRSKEIFLEVNKNNKPAINLYTQFNFLMVGLRKNYYQTNNGKEDALIFRCLL